MAMGQMTAPIPKNKPLRLKGAALQQLYDEVKGRDRYHCQHPDCGVWTLETPHHIKTKGAGGADIEENLILLCMKHHNMVHKALIECPKINQFRGS